MKKSNANAVWNGTLKEGKGTFSFTGYEGPFTFASRFESGEETNPEELVGAAQAGCYSMFLSALITGAGRQSFTLISTPSDPLPWNVLSYFPESLTWSR